MPVVAPENTIVGTFVVDVMQRGEVRVMGELEEKVGKSGAAKAAVVIPVTAAIARLKDSELGRAALKAHGHVVLGASHAQDVTVGKHIGDFNRWHATFCAELLHVRESEYGQAASKARDKRYARNAILRVGVDAAKER